MKRNLILLLISGLILIHGSINAQIIYVDVKNGNDNNKGTEELPIQSLFKAAEIANSNTEGSTTIKLAPGFYVFSDKVVFNNNKYTKNDRLIIEAEIMPDDAGWNPYSMPVITSIATNSINFGFECSLAFNIEVNHATIRGLKFTGNSNPEVFFYYPIGRSNTDLKDFVLSQCLFVGDRDASPIQSGVLIHGDEIKVDHCIFNNCKNTVVYYALNISDLTKKRHNSGMSYCIINSAYESAIWTVSPDENFEFHNNIVLRSANAFLHNTRNKTNYKITDCIFYDNELIYAQYENSGAVKSTNQFIEKNVKNIPVELVMMKNISMTSVMEYDYLHVEQESEAAKLNAGLFIKDRKLSAYKKYYKILDNNGFEKAFEKLNQMKNEELFFFDEAKFIAEGYNFLLSGKPDEAIKIFTIVTEKFPKSSNAFDSLAEAYLKKGDNKIAKIHYQEALKLDPENENAMKMITEIEKRM